MAWIPSPPLVSSPSQPQLIAFVFTNQMDQRHSTGYPVLTRAITPAPSYFTMVNTTVGYSG